ncbi:proline--tRNA ligase [Candidatus Saccharibacteria bacterium]|nr:MAG: proline--tRNA ligase [Candidatus Saccharibacteria bacterium]
MKVSQLVTRTSKTAPAEEVAKNAQLLIRAGYVYKNMAGVYSYTPIGLRVLERIKHVVREEMDGIGGQELIMSSLQPKETWEKTGRWDEKVVDIWFKSHLQDGTEVGFGWSHEEPIIEMLKTFISSYKDLPVYVHQFQTKLRNEVRAKSGIMRGREFVMNDMYSMCVDEPQHEAFYQAAMDAYMRVFARIGLGDDTYITYASGGAFTTFSHEFQTICDAGEDYIFLVPSTKQAFNAEIAPVKSAPVEQASDMKKIEVFDEPETIGVEALVAKLGIPITSSTKTMLYDTDKGLIAAVVRSDYKLNEDKLKAVADADWLQLATAEQVRKVTGAELGFAGLYRLPETVHCFVDESCEHLVNFETGANETGKHAYNVNWEQDVAHPTEFYDIKLAKQGDLYPETGEAYEVYKTAEVGNIFNFGTKKSEDMDFAFTNEVGVRQFVHLGSYGIGITRLMGVIAEKFSDEKGLNWPAVVAPYQLYVIQIGQETEVVENAEKLCEIAQSWGVTVLYDDTDKRPGEKFADADLLGIPHRVVVSSKTIKAGNYEYKARTSGDAQMVSIDKLRNMLTV